MKTITFECETIAPMFLAGADGKTPELRPPSIKGAMRFWWRAMNAGNFETIAKLKEAESKIFGGGGENGGRSKVMVWVSKQPDYNKNTDKDFLLLHKDGNRKGELPCFKEKKEFVFHVELQNEINISKKYTFNEEKLAELIFAISYLGGLGKGSRRGFGAFFIKKWIKNRTEQKEIKLDISKLEQKSNLNFPFIKKIEISKNTTSILKIRKQSHILHQKDYNEAFKISKQNDDTYRDKRGNERPNRRYLKYPKSLGDGANRFASPIYVSVIKKADGKLYTVITTLNTVPPNNGSFDKNIQEEFINSLL